MERMENKILKLSSGQQYLVVPRELQHRATMLNHRSLLEDLIHNKEQEKRRVAQAEKNPYNQQCGPTFCVIYNAQICVSSSFININFDTQQDRWVNV